MFNKRPFSEITNSATDNGPPPKKTHSYVAKASHIPDDFKLNGEYYTLVETHENTVDFLTTRHLCSAGSDKREIIFLDMEDKALQPYWEKFKYLILNDPENTGASTPMILEDCETESKQTKPPEVTTLTVEPKQWLRDLVHYVCDHSKALPSGAEGSAIKKKIVEQENKDAPLADAKKISLAAVLRSGVVFCRDEALLAGFLLTKTVQLAKEHISGFADIEQHVFNYRNDIAIVPPPPSDEPQCVGHTVAVYEIENERYLIDCRRKLCLDVANLSELSTAKLKSAFPNLNIMPFVDDLNKTLNAAKEKRVATSRKVVLGR